MLEVFASSFLSVQKQMPWRNLQTKVHCMYSFHDLRNSQNLRSCGSISLKTLVIFPIGKVKPNSKSTVSSGLFHMDTPSIDSPAKTYSSVLYGH